MSDYLTPALYKGRSLELQWMNNTCNAHDLFCGCNNPIAHLHHIIYKDNKQLCLPSTEDGDGGEDNHGDDVILPGDLENLFAENFTEEDTG